MPTIRRAYADAAGAEQALVRLRALGVPLVQISLVGPGEADYDSVRAAYSGEVQPDSYFVTTDADDPGVARQVEAALDDEASPQTTDETRPLGAAVETWQRVEVEHTPYGVAPEHHPPMQYGVNPIGEEEDPAGWHASSREVLGHREQEETDETLS